MTLSGVWGFFRRGVDEDGLLFCNQSFADYPLEIPKGVFDAASLKPKWMLLSYNKPVTASSGTHPEYAVNEDIRNWWSAGKEEP